MKSLYLLRHAKSSWADSSLADHDRPLSRRGRRAAPLMGAYLRDGGHRPELVLCSTSARTRETLEAVIAGASGNRSELTHEAADVLYHLMVLLAANGITLDEVLDELERRRGMSGIEEKRQRSDGSS